MKKIICVLLSVFMLLPLLLSCGRENEKAPETTGEEQKTPAADI